MRRRHFCAGLLLIATPYGAWAQWLHYPAPGTPRTRDGKANLIAPAPRGQDGKPDLSGIWAPESTPIPELLGLVSGADQGGPAPLGSEPITKYFLTVLADFKPADAPLKPGVTVRPDDPALRCLPTGMPMFDTYPQERKIVQTRGLILILAENDNTFRQIFMDGRQPPDDPEPSWLGSSIGRWEGDSLVVETTGLNALSSLDLIGHRHSDKLRITERFHRVNFGHMELQLTLDDSQTFTKPVTIKFTYVLLPDTDLIEAFCSENEKDHLHIAVK